MRRHRPHAHRVPVPRRFRPAGRRRAVSGLSALPRMGRRQAGDDPHARYRRRQAHPRPDARGRIEPVPGPARRPADARPARDIHGRSCGHWPAPLSTAISRSCCPWSPCRTRSTGRRRCSMAPSVRLQSEGVDCARPPLGIMVEVPAVAIAPDLFAAARFFSIGSNDLIQYVTAAARGEAGVASLYDSSHPAVLRLIAEVARFGAATAIPVSLCGDMASRAAPRAGSAQGWAQGSLGRSCGIGPGQSRHRRNPPGKLKPWPASRSREIPCHRPRPPNTSAFSQPSSTAVRPAPASAWPPRWARTAASSRRSPTPPMRRPFRRATSR